VSLTKLPWHINLEKAQENKSVIFYQNYRDFVKFTINRKKTQECRSSLGNSRIKLKK
jgi:hypothetical protein